MVKSHVECSPDLTWALVQKANVFVRRSRSATRQKTFRSFSAETNNPQRVAAPTSTRCVRLPSPATRSAAAEKTARLRASVLGTAGVSPAAPGRSRVAPRRRARLDRRKTLSAKTPTAHANSPRFLFPVCLRPRARRRRHQGCRRQEPHRGRHDRRRQVHVRQGALPAAGEDRRQPLRRGRPGPHGTSETPFDAFMHAFFAPRARASFLSKPVAPERANSDLGVLDPLADPQVDALKKIPPWRAPAAPRRRWPSESSLARDDADAFCVLEGGCLPTRFLHRTETLGRR